MLNLCGKDGVIGDACVAIIDGEPGLLMDLADGEPGYTFYSERELNPDSAVYRQLSNAREALLQDPEKLNQTCSELGLHAIFFDDDAIQVSGSADHPESSTGAAVRAASGSYQREMNRAQLVLYLRNASDAHGENMLLSERAGVYALTLIDCVECMGAHDMQALLGEMDAMTSKAGCKCARATRLARCSRAITDVSIRLCSNLIKQHRQRILEQH